MTSSSASPDLASRFDTFCQSVEEARTRYGVPGVGVGVLHASQELTAGFGVTNLSHPLPVDSDTLFQIGSTTKTYTATVAIMLAEAGKLDLDIPIRTYLPTFRLADEQTAATATLRHLFTHCAGWVGDFFINTGRGEDALQRYADLMIELSQEFPLGEAWAYNNAGFSLAGLVIQEVSGKAYEQVVREMILEPLGMEMSFFFPEDVIVHRTVSGHYTPEEGEAKIAQPWALNRSANPAGGIVANAKDQLRYARFHLGDGSAPDGKRLLSSAAIRAMQETQRKSASLAQEVGISWLIRYMGGLRTVGHGGATTGQFSAFEMVPSHDFALILTTNGSRGRLFNSAMVKRALEVFLDVQIPAPHVVKLDAAALAPYPGEYRAALANVTITAQDGGLVLASQPKGGFPEKETPPPPAPPPAPFVFTGTHRIQALEGSMQGSMGEFLTNADGAIRGLHLGGRIYHRM
jgi:CubicO group peptidase (beta-lactamase class C family)